MFVGAYDDLVHATTMKCSQIVLEKEVKFLTKHHRLQMQTSALDAGGHSGGHRIEHPPTMEKNDVYVVIPTPADSEHCFIRRSPHHCLPPPPPQGMTAT